MVGFKKFLLALPGFATFCRLLTRRHVRVFMYHRFCDDASNGEGLQASVFREQLRLIVVGHTLWTPEDQLRARAGDPVSGFCPVVITADDGYLDYYDVAYPILREFGVHATLFVTTGFIDGTDWMWWDKLRYLGEKAPPMVVEMVVAGEPVTLDFSRPGGRRAAVRYLINRGRFIPDKEKFLALHHLAEQLHVALPEQPPAAMSAINWHQIREMQGQGQIFAPHTVTHPILTRVTAADAEAEIRASRDRLAEVLGSAGRVFAYPQGGPSDFNDEVSRCVIACGLEASYLAYQGPELENNVLQLPRYCAGECLTAFRWSLCGAQYLANRLRKMLGAVLGPGVEYWEGKDPAA
jgi:peptidoglycan/xylan/chitin deacetylase (PgdA/CDA1 family)